MKILIKIKDYIQKLINKITYFFNPKKLPTNNDSIFLPLSIENTTYDSTIEPLSLEASNNTSSIKNDILNKKIYINNYNFYRPIISTTSIFRSLEIQAVSIISLTPNINNKSISTLKIAVFFNDILLFANDGEFLLLINNLIIVKPLCKIMPIVRYNTIIELTATIPSMYNFSNIYYCLGCNYNANQIQTMSIYGTFLKPIFPYIIGDNIKAEFFKWLKYTKEITISSKLYYKNIFLYKLSSPLNKDLFYLNFGIFPNESKTIISNVTINDNNSLYDCIIDIPNYTYNNDFALIGSITIKYSTSKFINEIILNKTINVTLLLSLDCTLISFEILLPKDFIDNITIFQIYYTPTEYSLITNDGKRFVNSSYRVLAKTPIIIKDI